MTQDNDPRFESIHGDEPVFPSSQIFGRDFDDELAVDAGTVSPAGIGELVPESETQGRPVEAIAAALDADPPEPEAPSGDDLEPLRQFALHRTDDVTGVHSDGLIAHGVVFPDGKVALWWGTSVAVWRSLEDLEAVHLHPRSKTRVIWLGDA